MQPLTSSFLLPLLSMVLLTTQLSVIPNSLRTEAMYDLLKIEAEKSLFLMSLLGATIQDGGKRERRNG